MRRIKQKAKTDCGLACVAMVAKRSHKKVWSVFCKVPRENFYTTNKQIYELLQHFKIDFQHCRYAKRWDSVSDVAIVAINYRMATNTWHWVVFYRDKNSGTVLDPNPKIRLPRSDFGRMKIKSYIPIGMKKE
jgi:ABC-type bacteriocin/lantibiotic exporter with double-glycine peptidase domain